MTFTDFMESMGHPVAYYPALAEVTGSVTATVFLCQMLYWRGRGHNPDGWIYKTCKELTGETGLSRREQESARKLLKKLGFLEERLACIPARLHYRLNIGRINDRFEEVLLRKDAKEGKKSLIKQQSARNVQTRMRETEKQGCGKRTNKDAGNAQTITESTTETTTENIYTAQGSEQGEEREKTFGGSRRMQKESNPAIKRLVDWYFEMWGGLPPEKLNGGGAGRVARIFSELLSSLKEREGLLFPEEHVKKLYEFYRTAEPSGKNDEWLFGDAVKSLVRFRGKFADIEE